MLLWVLKSSTELDAQDIDDEHHYLNIWNWQFQKQNRHVNLVETISLRMDKFKSQNETLVSEVSAAYRLTI